MRVGAAASSANQALQHLDASSLQCMCLSPSFAVRTPHERHHVYPYWCLASCLLDTAEVIEDEFKCVLGEQAVEHEAHVLAAHALCVLAACPADSYR